MTYIDDWPCPVYRLQGPPGTGKTHTLTRTWIPRAVDLYGEERVHACSLTRSAAAELGGRASLPRKRVSTLHSLALNAMGRPGLAEDPENVKDWNNSVVPEWRLTGKARTNNPDDLGFTLKSAEGGDELMANVTVLRNRMIPLEEWEGPEANFYRAWRKWKQERQFADFTDLLSLPVEFNIPPPDDIRALICDEAQDYTYLAVALLKHWAGFLDMVVMAGDANQALYGFIGANPHAFMPAGIPESEITTLKQSYRVPKHPLEYANKWIQQDTDHRIFEYAPRQEDGVTVEGCVAHKPEFSIDKPRGLVKNILQVTDDGSTAMVLTSCKYQLGSITHDLRVMGVPFHNPYRVTEGAWNPMRGGVKRLAAFLRPYRPELEGGEDGWTWEEFHQWSSVVKARGTFRHGAVREIDAKKKQPGHLTQEDVRLLMTPEAYHDMLEAFQEDDPAVVVEWLESRMLKSGTALMEMALSVFASRGVAALEEDPRVIVGTLHSAKGGAADYVYLAPDLGSSAMREWDNLSQPDGRNAIVRAYYVGITRARKAVALMGAASRNAVKWI